MLVCCGTLTKFSALIISRVSKYFTQNSSLDSLDFGNLCKKIVFDGTFDEMRMSKDPYLIEMVSKEFKSDESGTDKKKKTKDGFQIDFSISLSNWLIECC